MTTTKPKYNSTAIICVAIGAIAALEVVALLKGIDGILLTGAIAVIAGLAGWTAPQLKI